MTQLQNYVIDLATKHTNMANSTQLLLKMEIHALIHVHHYTVQRPIFYCTEHYTSLSNLIHQVCIEQNISQSGYLLNVTNMKSHTEVAPPGQFMTDDIASIYHAEN